MMRKTIEIDNLFINWDHITHIVSVDANTLDINYAGSTSQVTGIDAPLMYQTIQSFLSDERVGNLKIK